MKSYKVMLLTPLISSLTFKIPTAVHSKWFMIKGCIKLRTSNFASWMVLSPVLIFVLHCKVMLISTVNELLNVNGNHFQNELMSYACILFPKAYSNSLYNL